MLSRVFPALAVVVCATSVGATQPEVEKDDFFVNCISDLSSEGVTLVRSGGSDKGYIMTSEMQGEANIYPGVDSMTFLLMQDSRVITFVVEYSNLEYDMMVKGDGHRFDKGKCEVS